MFLSDTEIKKLITEKNLIREYIDVDRQLQPNGFDLTVCKVFAFRGYGVIDFTNEHRVLPPIKEMRFKYKSDTREVWELKHGAYLIQFNEIVSLPKDLFALTIQRSTLMRCGCDMQVGLWDAGYEGKGYSILKVHNMNSILLHKNARVCQMLFLSITGAEIPYQGIYQFEGVEKI